MAILWVFAGSTIAHSTQNARFPEPTLMYAHVNALPATRTMALVAVPISMNVQQTRTIVTFYSTAKTLPVALFVLTPMVYQTGGAVQNLDCVGMLTPLQNVVQQRPLLIRQFSPVLALLVEGDAHDVRTVILEGDSCALHVQVLQLMRWELRREAEPLEFRGIRE